MQKVITDGFLRGLKPPDVGRIEIRDTTCRGLVLRLTPGGTATWSTRGLLPSGKHGRVTLGTWPHVGIADARRRAKQAVAATQAGADPVQAKREARVEAKALAARPTVADLWREYSAAKIATGKWSENHTGNSDAFFARVLEPVHGKRALADVTRADWTALIAAEGKKGQGARATALRLIRGFDNFAEVSGWIDRAALPRMAAAVLAPPVRPRQRTPSDDELVAIWRGAEALRPKARCFIRLLVLTSARRSEVADLRAGELDLDADAGPVWRLPPGRSKNRLGHVMPLHKLALDELRVVWPVQWGEKPDPEHRVLGANAITGLQDFSKVKSALDEESGVTGWVLHDLRRSARATMARLGVPRDHAEAALSHVSHRSALERTYDTHNYLTEAISALRTWQSYVATLIEPGMVALP
jgi:integrase